MGVFQNNLLAGAAAAASAGGAGFYDYQIEQSIRIDRASTSYLSGPTMSSTNNTKYSLSFWVKRGDLGTYSPVTGSSGGGHNLVFNTDNTFQVSTFGNMDSDPIVYRDTGGWYHFFIYWGTSDGSWQIYVNGVQQTLSTNTAGGVGYFVNGSNINIGASNNGTYMFDGYIAEVLAFYDQQKAHTDFGEFKNGVWIPKEYTGSFGNSRDFHLKFENASDLGNDSSGNNNDFTSNNLGADHQVLDSPTFGS